VKPGDIVNAGDKIGEVGRTGRKAILPGGKTHIHVAFLKSADGYPIPEDIIKELRSAEKRFLSGD
jgi:murein DD-endopeptidase MepM/ murein hydrolase activator NlpD